MPVPYGTGTLLQLYGGLYYYYEEEEGRKEYYYLLGLNKNLEKKKRRKKPCHGPWPWAMDKQELRKIINTRSSRSNKRSPRNSRLINTRSTRY